MEYREPFAGLIPLRALRHAAEPGDSSRDPRRLGRLPERT
jgi:hypothetical protein